MSNIIMPFHKGFRFSGVSIDVLEPRVSLSYTMQVPAKSHICGTSLAFSHVVSESLFHVEYLFPRTALSHP